MRASLLLVLLMLSLTSRPTLAQTVRGTVFADANRNGRRDISETALPGVLVSNGEDVVPTDASGSYRLRARPGRPVFLLKPRNYAPLHHAAWYQAPGHPPAPRTDFALVPAAEPTTFEAVLLGDIQAGDQDDLYHFNHLVTEELYDDPYAFSLTLGDVTFDQLAVYPRTKASLQALGKPVYAIFGNHDQNYEVRDPAFADTTFQRYFGPTHYAWQYGATYFIALNDVAYLGQKKYEGRVSDEQLAFLANYLRHTDPQALHVLAMHIPLDELTNRAALMAALAGHPNVLFVTAHEHRNRRQFHTASPGTTWQEVVVGATCGSWWQGEHDVFGIPSALMGCGAPKGYWKLAVQANGTYQLRYKASQYPADFQVSVWTPEDQTWDPAQNLPADSTRALALVNVFAGSERTQVQFRVDDGAWQPTARTTATSDPNVARLYQLQARGRYPSSNASRLSGQAEPSPHLWRAALPTDLRPGTHKLEVRATEPGCPPAKAYRVLTVLPAK
jgi:hypothetical protein